jgi:sugar lactone lactonase YvrE
MGGTIGVPAIEVAAPVAAQLGEGPAWDERTQTLWWVDIDSHRLWCLPPGDEPAQHDFGQELSAVLLRASGGFALGLRRSVAFTDAELTITGVLQMPLERDAVRLNDGACDPAGRLWIGSMATDGRAGLGALFRVSAEHDVSPVMTGVSISNGPGWSPDARTMYHVDTPTGRIDAYPYDVASGRIGQRRAFAHIPPELGRPDGLAVDADGCVWVAVWGGASVRAYTPDGQLARSICLPVSNVTSLCFGGRLLDELYITTARRGLDADALAAQQLAGAVFVCRPGRTGLPQARFAG